MLDLDQTLLHYVPVSQLSDKEKYLMEEPESRVDLLRFNEENPEHMIKLRPFLREFLKEANKLFRMHVYTMSSYGYARDVLSFIDPGKRYFGNRVITREKSPHKKTLDLISADQRRVVIVDDNTSVWPQHKPNLLQVSQYIYFRYQMTNNNSEEDSYSYAEKESDECRSNGALSNVLKLLQKAHTRFQQEEDSNDLRLLIRD
ncbi:PREDICTED: RNA polymerase II C-terminal domain phosphatase-like 4 [Brassica oleracea var. oleracea]|uniref:RNA polymerase II C-terminal domain phosphatase-like 4 n=1 Tax=Brassica oleracea var. oleracea TaxID=109376 RepID=UPI0006A6AE4C|nr:PREDICTED: RNA polymerase II C-terminal domain phosphatase-like 4 [Brassica oleracea var. oleracea]